MKTKKIVSLLLALVMLLSITAGLSVSAFAEESGDYEYEVLEDGTAEILAYWGEEQGTLVIPSLLDGYTVTSIGDYAFAFTSAASIQIPDSVTNIGLGAFAGSETLTSIIVSGTNENYSSLGGVLFNKDQTELVAYPSGIEASSYTIPQGVTAIGAGAFANCYLTAVEIPEGVETIGNSAFINSFIETAEIPASVTSIGSGAFLNCYELTSINVSGNNADYSSVDGVLFNKDQTELIAYPTNKEDSSYTVPDSVKAIADHAFYGNLNLTSVDIPGSVSTIGVQAFAYCNALADITLGEGVTEILEEAFFGTAVTDVIIPDSVKTVDPTAFDCCYELSSITFGSGVESISTECFVYLENLKSFYILNRECEILDGEYSGPLPSTVTIYGYTDSTAQAYAEKNGLKFVALDAQTDEPTTQKPADKPATEKPTNAPATEAETKPAQNNADTSDSKKSPSTGAESKALFAIAAIALAGGAAMFIKKKEND